VSAYGSDANGGELTHPWLEDATTALVRSMPPADAVHTAIATATAAGGALYGTAHAYHDDAAPSLQSPPSLPTPRQARLLFGRGLYTGLGQTMATAGSDGPATPPPPPPRRPVETPAATVSSTLPSPPMLAAGARPGLPPRVVVEPLVTISMLSSPSWAGQTVASPGGTAYRPGASGRATASPSGYGASSMAASRGGASGSGRVTGAGPTFSGSSPVAGSPPHAANDAARWRQLVTSGVRRTTASAAALASTPGPRM